MTVGINRWSKFRRKIRQYLASFVAVLLLLSSASVAVAQDDTVRILMRSDHLSLDLIERFTQSTGMAVHSDIYDPKTSADVRSALIAGTSGYDVILAPANFLNLLAEQHQVKRIEWRNVSESYAISSQVQKFLVRYNPTSETPLRLYGVPYMFGTTGIGYFARVAAARLRTTTPNSLKYIFDPEYVSRFADCGVGLADAPGEVVRSALRYLGEDPLSNDPTVLQRAEAVLLAIQPYIKGVFGADLGDRLAGGELCLGFGWSGDILRAGAAQGALTIDYAIPEEGGPLWLDMLAVPMDAGNVDGAYALMSFMMKAETAAQISRNAHYVSTNVAGNLQNYGEGVLEDERVWPDWETFDRLFMAPAENEEVSETINQIWVSFRSGLEETF